MRGAVSDGERLFMRVKLEYFVPASHPLRLNRTWVHDTLTKMTGQISAMYEADIKGGRLSGIAPKLTRALLYDEQFRVDGPLIHTSANHRTLLR